MKLIKNCEENQAFNVADSFLKQTSHRGLLEILYKQCKNLKNIQVLFEKNKSLQVNYWPGYASCILFTIGAEGIEISHTPNFEFSIQWSNDITEILAQIITQHKLERLSKVSHNGKIVNQRLEIVAVHNSLICIDICYFTGEFIAYIDGRIEKSLSEMLKTSKIDENIEKVVDLITLRKFESSCRCVNKTLNYHPLRFSRIFHSFGIFSHKSFTIGYIDLGVILPTDSMGHIINFAVRFSGREDTISELVGYNETDEEYNIPIESLKNFKHISEFVKTSILIAKQKMILLRIPIAFLAKPDIIK